MRPASLSPVFKLRVLASLFVILAAATPFFGQGAERLSQVSGVVADPSGAAISEARVIIRRKGTSAEQTTTTNEKGEFHFTQIESGSYEIEVQKEGFKPTITQVEIGRGRTPSLQIVLPIAELHEEIVIGDDPVQTSTNPEENLDVVKLDREQLRDLPVLGNDIIASVTQLLDAGSVGSGGTSLIVDGLETSKTKSARLPD